MSRVPDKTKYVILEASKIILCIDVDMQTDGLTKMADMMMRDNRHARFSLRM